MTAATRLLQQVTKTAVLCLAASFSLADAAHGDAIYEYTGDNFTFAGPGYEALLSTSITGSLALSSALAPNLTAYNALPDVTGFSLLVGGTPLGSLLPGPVTLGTATVTTDGSGNIVEWAVVASSTDGIEVLGLFICNHPTSTLTCGLGFDAVDLLVDSGFSELSDAVAYNLDSPGTWSIVPEPSSVALVALGIAGLGAARRRGA